MALWRCSWPTAHYILITASFSYVAIISGILWEDCEPVYMDIDPKICRINSNSVEVANKPETTTILT